MPNTNTVHNQQPGRSLETMPLTFIKIFKRRAKRDAHKVMAWRVEEIAPVRRVDIKEDARDNDRLFLQQLFKERLFKLSKKNQVRFLLNRPRSKSR